MPDSGYTEVVLPAALPEPERQFIRHLEQYFRDVNRMLRVPAMPGLSDCGRPIAMMLIAAIDGIATPLRRRGPGNISAAFVEVMRAHFPWDRFSVTDTAQIDQAAKLIFHGFRNLLAHGGGTLPPSHGQGLELDLDVIRGVNAYTDMEVLSLEAGRDPPAGWPLTCVGTYMFRLSLPHFYWGTRQLVANWSQAVTPAIAARRKRKLTIGVDGTSFTWPFVRT